MRVDANVSMRPVGTDTFGTRCEIKNLNSIRSLGRAIEYEAKRQIELLEAGERIIQQTRHWNEDEGRTHTLRSKEEADDYRYFPEPDLVPLAPDAEWIDAARASLPRLPADRRSDLASLAGVDATSGAIAVAVERDLDALAAAAIAAGGDKVTGAHPRRAQPRRRGSFRARSRRARRTHAHGGRRGAHRDPGQGRARGPRREARHRSGGHREGDGTSRRWRPARSTRSSTRSSPRTRTSGSATARETTRPAASSRGSLSAR